MNDYIPMRRHEWSSRHRPLSFSHQEVTSEAVKHHRQLRHSVSQREVSRHSRQSSVDSRGSSVDLKKPAAPNVETGSNLSSQNPTVAKSTPQLPQTHVQRHSSSSSSLLQSDVDDVGNTSMVTRRFKKGSVYDTLASTSGLDFSPVVQLKTYHSRRDGNNSQMQTNNPTSMPQEKSTKPLKEISPLKDVDENKKEPINSSSTMNQSPIIPPKQGISDKNANANCINAHEKYPSWPAGPPESESWSASQRSHSWTEQTDYPKEKVGYSRPKKDNQFKISTNQLQPVLERAPDYNKIPREAISSVEKIPTGDKYQTSNTHARGSGTFIDCNGKQFDFEGFHTPCIPQYFEDKGFPTHSPPVREGSVNDSLNTSSSVISDSSNNFNSRYEEVFHNDAQFSGPVSAKCKIKTPENKNEPTPQGTPFLDRLRMENSWNGPPPSYAIHPAAVSPHPPPQMQHPQEQQGNDFEVSSENGTWMGSMESSTHERILPKWQGSYSDLSTLSTQFSNRSSMFDSGHSTLPESGRLSPQSSCDSTVTSLLLEGSTRAQVVARHGCHREIVAHSARVQPPERHGSESVLYYTGASSSRSKSCDNSNIRNFPKNSKPVMDDSSKTAEKALFRSHASLTLSPPMPKSKALQSKEQCNTQFPKRQNSRNNLNSHFDDSNSQCSNSTATTPDVINAACKPNYKEHSKNVEKSCPMSNKAKPTHGHPTAKSKSMDETAKSCSFTEIDKKRVSDPDLKAIQKQAVMSFYQRKSLAESIKSDSKLDSEPPPPYEARSSHKLRMSPPKLSLLPNKPKLIPSNCSEVPRPKNVPVKASDPALLRNHSKSVPNLVRLKGQSLDLPPSHPFFKQTYNGVEGHSQKEKPQGSPLAKDEIISWDELPNVLERKRELQEKAASSSNEKKDPPEDNDGCTSGQKYLKGHRSPRKVCLKEVHHSNETASVQVMTPEGVTLVQTNEKKIHKRRPAPPPPPKQPPRRPPPPPPPDTPPLSQIIVENKEELESSVSGCSPCSSDLPLPPPPTTEEVMIICNDPLPPPPDSTDININARITDNSSLIYPKNSYMSYRSEKKLARQGFDGKYHRSFSTSASSIDLTSINYNNQERNEFSPNTYELKHNIRQHATTVIFHSDSLQQMNCLHKSNSQNYILREDKSQNVSEVNENNKLANSVKENDAETLHWAEPYQEPDFDSLNSESQKLQTSFQTSSETVAANSNNFDTCSNNSSVRNSLQNSENKSDVDYNQNSVICQENNNVVSNESDKVQCMSNAIQAPIPPKVCHKTIKTQAEIECERLSREFINRYGEVEYKNLFITDSTQKTLADYMEGLINIEFEKNSNLDLDNSVMHKEELDNNQNEENSTNKETEIVELNTENTQVNDNQSKDNEAEFKRRKEELITSIEQKLESLRQEQTIIRTEMLQNNLLGEEVCDIVQKMAKPNETEKYILHVEELEKIINLLLSLSGRLARAENNLRNIPKNCDAGERKALETKCNKLKEQHEDACRLKECIDRRSNQVTTFLLKYFSDEEYAKYDYFIKRKTKFLIDIREIDEKINLGEEQLAALNAVAQLWKSANS